MLYTQNFKNTTQKLMLNVAVHDQVMHIYIIWHRLKKYHHKFISLEHRQTSLQLYVVLVVAL